MALRWWWYLGVVVGAIAVALVIVGPPDDTASDRILSADAPSTSVVPTTSAPPVEVSSASTTSSTAPDDRGDGTTTTQPPSRATTTVAATSSTTTASTAPPTTEAPDETFPSLVEPASLHVVAANGSGVDGEAGRFADALLALGYTDVSVTNGRERVEASRVYFADPLWLEAIRLSDELGLDRDIVERLENAPVFVEAGDEPDLLVYLGTDRAAP